MVFLNVRPFLQQRDTPMSRAAVFFGCCKALAEPSLLSLAGSGILGSFNILQIGSAAPVFRIQPYTEGERLWGIIQWHYLLFIQKGKQLAPQFHTGFSASSAKIFLYWHLQWDELVILKHFAHRLRLAWLFIPLASVHGLCIINYQNRGLDVICCCVTFNNCKIKM